MNEFDVQAIGWMVTRHLSWEAARAFLGLERTLSLGTVERLGERWQRVAASVHDDRMARDGWAGILCPRRLPLSVHTVQAARAFIDLLVASCPQLYGYFALRRRCLAAAVQVLLACVCWSLVRHWVPAEDPLLGQAALVLVVMGGWSLVVTIQTWRTCRLVLRLGADPALVQQRTV